MLISNAKSANDMRQVENIFPTSSEIKPSGPALLLLLSRVKDVGTRLQVADTAVQRAGGKRPSVKLLKQVVAEVLGGQDEPTLPKVARPKQNQETRCIEVWSRLKIVVDAEKDWNLAAALVTDLGRLLRAPHTEAPRQSGRQRQTGSRG